MSWHYRCPVCGEWRTTGWKNVGKLLICHRLNQEYTVPGPAQQPDAYVDTREWPVEMERAVLAKKGCKCVGCGKPWETLDHIVPVSRRGKTSVRNLQPMCNTCNQSKGDKPFVLWLAVRANSNPKAPIVKPSPFKGRFRRR